MAQDLAGRRVLVTGAGSGIGAELARRLSARGARLGLLDRRAGPLAEVAAALSGAGTAIAGLRDAPALTAAVDDRARRLGGIDVVVANAGIATSGPVHLTGPEAFEATIDVNLLGTWRAARAALPHLMRRRGYLLLVASAAAIQPLAHVAAYSASKAGVEAFGRAARTEMRHHGVDVGVAYFPFLDTPMVAGACEQAAFSVFERAVARPIGRTYPLGPAVGALVRGIQRRSRVVAYPGFLRVALVLRRLLELPFADRPLRHGRPRAEAAFAREAARIGAEPPRRFRRTAELRGAQGGEPFEPQPR